MKKLTYILVVSLALAACNNSERDHRDNAAADTILPLLDTTNKAQVYTADVDLNGDEKVFLLNTYLSVKRITAFAHLANQRTKNSDLRTQAKKLEDQYRKMSTDLESLAKGKGILLNNDINSNTAEELNILEKEQDINFDKMYLKLILVEHANLSQQLDNGIKISNVDFKNFATNSLKTVNQNNSDIAKILK